MFAPPSTTSTGWPALGNSAPIAARCTPGCRRSRSVAAATTARARLQRGDDGFIVCAASALLALRRSALGYGHFRFVLRLRAEFVLEHLQRLPAGIGRGRAIAGAGVEILATLWA